MKSSGKADEKVERGLHTGGLRVSQQPFMTVP